MKFDQAIKEGFENYVSEDEDQISIGRDVLESIRDLINDDDVVKIAVEKHRDNPELFKAINKLIFKVDSLLAPNKEEFPGKDEEESVKIQGYGSGNNPNDVYDLDSAVERQAQKRSFGIRGFGNTAYNARKATKERDNLVKKAIDVYKQNTKKIADQLNNSIKNNASSTQQGV